MNKPATKEPSMDEILSSIRQIIADDDASAPSKRLQPPADAGLSGDGPRSVLAPSPAENEPLALSADQILQDEESPAKAADVSDDFGAFVAEEEEESDDALDVKAEFIDPDDITFTPPVKVEDERPQPLLRQSMPLPPPPVFRAPPPPVLPSSPPLLRPRPTAAQAAPMPDPKLSADIAEELLEPATGSAVRANFARLNNLGLGDSGLTIEALMRDMLRPMLKEWLDEHLPTMVERIVEKEITRISRGVD